MTAEKPLHLVATSADRKTICGADIRDRGMPFVLAAYLQMHQDKRGPLLVCGKCAER